MSILNKFKLTHYPISILLVIYVFAVFIPGIAVYVRRLHDTGRSGWWFLIILVPFGVFVLLVFLVEDSQADENKYGPNPKEEKISLPEEREKEGKNENI